MALILRALLARALVVGKMERRGVTRQTERIKDLGTRLDAVIKEGRRLRAQIEEVSPVGQVPELRDMVKKQARRRSLV